MKLSKVLETHYSSQVRNLKGEVDVLKFSGKADANLLAKMSPTIMWESEFDQYLTPTIRYEM